VTLKLCFLTLERAQPLPVASNTTITEQESCLQVPQLLLLLLLL
jgi:hypothetical protein